VAAAYRVVGGKIQTPACEVEIVEHCNLSCRSCSHLSPVLPKYSVDPDEVARDLTLLSRHYRARWVSLLGGEPLLHPDLMAVVDAARRSGVADVVRVVTNGLLLPRMPNEFWQAVDDVRVSLYPGRELSPAQQQDCRRHARAARVRLRFERPREFRESYSEQGTDDPGLAQAIFDSCRVAHDWRCHAVAHGRFYKCPQSYFLPKMVDGCAVNQALDSVPITDSVTFGEDLLAYLESPEPLASCGHCLGTAGRRFPQAQVRRVEFRGLQRRPAEELVDPNLLEPVRPGGPRSRVRSLVGRVSRSR